MPEFLILALVVATIWIYVALETKKRKEQQKQADITRLEAAAQRHQQTLLRRRIGLRSTNGYGAIDARAWQREINKFLAATGYTSALLPREEIGWRLGTWADRMIREQTISSALDPGGEMHNAVAQRDPARFEQACALILQRCGWQTQTLAGRGDQGVDVYARKDNISIVIQCKLWSKPVGNGAVQEALSGRAFMKADFAAVVTNSRFTKSAEELAGSSNVLLLHHHQLSQIDELIGIKASAPLPVISEMYAEPRAARQQQSFVVAKSSPSRKSRRRTKTASDAVGRELARYIIKGIFGNMKK